MTSLFVRKVIMIQYKRIQYCDFSSAIYIIFFLLWTVFGTWPQVATMCLRWNWSTALLPWNVTKMDFLFVTPPQNRMFYGAVRGWWEWRDAPDVSTVDYFSRTLSSSTRSLQANKSGADAEKDCIPWCCSRTICSALSQYRTDLIR